MEDVYVVKVKTKPPVSSVYPSERRYSASTVGGLALVHFGLGALALLLGTLAQSLQGPILSLACLVPFASGLLAWRRWYIDKNISIFFYGSLLSLIASVLCLVATVFDVAAATESGIGTPWRLESIPASPDQFQGHNLKGLTRRNGTFEKGPSVHEGGSSKVQDPNGFMKTEDDRENPVHEGRRQSIDNSDSTSTEHKERTSNSQYDNRHHTIFNERPSRLIFDGNGNPQEIESLPTDVVEVNEGQNDFALLNDDTDSQSLSLGRGSAGDGETLPLMDDENARRNSSIPNSFEERPKNYSNEETLGTFRNGIISFWHADPSTAPQRRMLLDINVLVACLLELFWSLLSAKISLRGMTNDLAEPASYQNDVDPAENGSRPKLKTKPRAPRPDILNHDGKNTGSMKSFRSLEGLQSIGPRLPMPESNREFRERVERFLANQAAHRVVEGSCS